MNIFVLHWKPRKAARWHVDKHVVKMLLETVQLLYTAHWVLYYPDLADCKTPIQLSKRQKELTLPPYMRNAPRCATTQQPAYRPCHTRHPCAVWTREKEGNYDWLVMLGLELAREFRFRFKKAHACEDHIIWLGQHTPPTIPKGERCDFAVAMDPEYQISNNALVCYRHYYRTAKKEKGLIKYTGRQIPHWLRE